MYIGYRETNPLPVMATSTEVQPVQPVPPPTNVILTMNGNTVEEIARMLHWYQENFTLNTCVECFPADDLNLGPAHFFHKWYYVDQNIFAFLNSLDFINRGRCTSHMLSSWNRYRQQNPFVLF